MADCVIAAVSEGVSLIEADLTEAVLTGAVLTGAELCDSDLTGADLTGADLRWADLRWSDLTGADLSRADLSDSDLSGADLIEADLTKVDLSGADLTGANLGNGMTANEPVIQIYNLPHPVTVFDSYMTIGCQTHSLSDWWAFTYNQIEAMDEGAAEEWSQYKTAIFELIRASGRTWEGM
ncbi:MAG: pentapeptide repeat-containing protein [Magnetospiraceae bacterium]